MTVHLQVENTRRCCLAVSRGEVDIAIVGGSIPHDLRHLLQASTQHPLDHSEDAETLNRLSCNSVCLKDNRRLAQPISSQQRQLLSDNSTSYSLAYNVIDEFPPLSTA